MIAYNEIILYLWYNTYTRDCLKNVPGLGDLTGTVYSKRGGTPLPFLTIENDSHTSLSSYWVWQRLT